MNLFEMSDGLIDKDEINFECVYYYLPPKFSKDLEGSLVLSTMWTLDGYYEGKSSVRIGYQHNNAIREMIKNARWHGGSKDNSPTYFGLFFNKENFVLGCNDGGDYFKREDIKGIWENKEELKEFHKPESKDVGYHFGYSYFKSKFDRINVDTEHGTLYGIVDVRKYLENLNKSDK
jgi:hypothetical protein